MEEENFLDEELTTLERLLETRETELTNLVESQNFSHLNESLQTFSESPFSLDPNTKVFLIEESKLSSFKSELKSLGLKVLELERNFSKELEEKVRLKEENLSLSKQVQNLTTQINILCSKSSKNTTPIRFEPDPPKTQPNFGFFPKSENQSSGFQILKNSQSSSGFYPTLLSGQKSSSFFANSSNPVSFQPPQMPMGSGFFPAGFQKPEPQKSNTPKTGFYPSISGFRPSESPQLSGFQTPQTAPGSGFYPKTSGSSQISEEKAKIPHSEFESTRCGRCLDLENTSKDFKKRLETKENEFKSLFDSFEQLKENISKEKTELTNWENSEFCWRLKSQIENQKSINVNLQIQIDGLKSQLRVYHLREKENMNGLTSITDKIIESFADLIEDGFETTSSDCDNEVICRYFPETIKRLKLKLQNENLRERLEEASKDLQEQRAENKSKIESFLKEVLLFEELKENTLKKIDEYLTMIHHLATEKIEKFNLNIEEFQLVDFRCLELTQKLEKSYKLIDELTERLGKNVEINKKLMERYEMDILINKTFIDDLNKVSKEKSRLEQEIINYSNMSKAEIEKHQREIKDLTERVNQLEKANKTLSIENELLNLTSKRCNEAINFQLYLHFRWKFETLSLETQEISSKFRQNQETIAELKLEIQRKNEEINRFKAKLAEQNPENILLTLLSIKDGSLRDLIQENMENKKNITDLNSEIDILTKQINERQKGFFQMVDFGNEENEMQAEEKNQVFNTMSIIELLEKSKVLLSLGSKEY